MNFLFIDFLNSEWRDGIHDDSYIDRLNDEKWVSELLSTWDINIDVPFTNNVGNELKQMRAFLRELVIELANGDLTFNKLEKLNTYFTRSPLEWSLISVDKKMLLTEKPLKFDWDWVVAKILHSFTDLLVNHQVSRLKICKNERCGWVFYDSSKNQSRVWCYHSNCGNLINVRKYRERRKNN